MSVNSTPLFIFRTQAGHHYGMGHIVRMTSLALHLRKLKPSARILFAVSGSRKSVQMLHDNHFPFLMVDEFNDLKKRLISIFEKEQKVTIFTDLYETKPAEERWFKSQKAKLIVFDDFARNRPFADFVVSVQPGKTKNRHFLGGVKYWVMHPDFARLNKQKKKVPVLPRTILIAMGGSDLKHLTPKVLKAILPMVKKHKIKVKAVLGDESRIKTSDLKRLLPGVQVLKGVRKMGPVIFSADLGISGGGFSRWEFVCLGVPLGVIAVVRHQKEYIGWAQKAGVLTYLGDVFPFRERAVEKRLEALMIDVSKRRHISNKGRRLVDGRGALRILKAVLN